MKVVRLLPLLLLFIGCSQPQEKQVSVIFQSEEEEQDMRQPDLQELEQNGEIIAVTLSGPDTYFEFRGQSFGLQHELVAHFARSKGLRIRMEIAHDTLELLQKLDNGEADVIALPMPKRQGYTLTAIQDTLRTEAHDTIQLGWLTRVSSKELAQALNSWYTPRIKGQLLAEQRRQTEQRQRFATRRHPRPKIKDATRGIISDYDNIFKRHARACNWDWRLLAAQCYQESAFDPQAVSWAGAQGLMQLMPSTAQQYGVQDKVFTPESNIQAATNLIHDLNDAFSDIANGDERINFILASYNGGKGHVRDAMALASKYGRDPHQWNQVKEYILLLSDARYYRDAVVKYGYMRGSETTHYVSSIRSHWSYYRGVAR